MFVKGSGIKVLAATFKQQTCFAMIEELELELDFGSSHKKHIWT